MINSLNFSKMSFRFLFFVVLLFSSSFARASYWKYEEAGFPSVQYPSFEAACKATIARDQKNSGTTYTYVRYDLQENYESYKAVTCVYKDSYDGRNYHGARIVGVVIEGDPPPPPPAKCDVPAGQPVTFGVYTGWGSMDAEVSDSSEYPGYANLPNYSPVCKVSEMTEIVACYAEKTNGKQHFYCVFKGISTGEGATQNNPQGQAPSGPPSDSAGPPKPSPVPPFTGKPGGGCPKGTVQGGINSDGVPICIGNGTAPVNTPAAPPIKTNTQTTANPDGGTTQTTTTVKTNTDGSTTTTVNKVITGPDGSKTVTETRDTSKTPTGADGRETSDKPEQKTFCQENPNLSICRESSVAGKCGEVSCVGDAIQCATLRAAAAMQCKQVADEEALKSMPVTNLGSAIMAGNDPLANDIKDTLSGQETDMSSMNIDQSGFLGSGACIAPKTFSFFGQSIVMDFASACQNAQPARYVILALAFIAAYLIVSKSVLNS